MELHYKEFLISDNQQLLNEETILQFLNRSYWANQRPREKTIKAIQNSLCIGVYRNLRQIGFARIVTDWATVFYLCDVFIDEEFRGQGIGKKLVEHIVNREDLKGLFGILGTKDAHELYKQYGFIEDPERFMKRLSQ